MRLTVASLAEDSHHRHDWHPVIVNVGVQMPNPLLPLSDNSPWPLQLPTGSTEAPVAITDSTPSSAQPCFLPKTLSSVVPKRTQISTLDSVSGQLNLRLALRKGKMGVEGRPQSKFFVVSLTWKKPGGKEVCCPQHLGHFYILF